MGGERNGRGKQGGKVARLTAVAVSDAKARAKDDLNRV